LIECNYERGNKMKVYVLSGDTYCGSWGSEISLFGVFSNKEEADKLADEMQCDISVVNIDEVEEPKRLGGYCE
jgi:hypothetical protein